MYFKSHDGDLMPIKRARARRTFEYFRRRPTHKYFFYTIGIAFERIHRAFEKCGRGAPARGME
jgi:hypothetical protein